MTILITGGAGFIGSHMSAQLLSDKVDFLVADNLSNSCLLNLTILEKKFKKKINFCQIDIRDKDSLEGIFLKNKIKKVIHFAALKSVDESQKNPDLYKDNNINGSINVIELAKQHNVKNFIFSSSACVYGKPQYLPINENHPLNPISVYGDTKLIVEKILINDDYFNHNCSTVILRYFNPIGSFNRGLIGERARGTPSNLMPYILGVIQGIYPYLNIYGDDYDTRDGSAIRDYIHVMDLIEAHCRALDYDKVGLEVLNVGTGRGYSVFEIIDIFQAVNNVKLDYKIVGRRSGDVPECFADSSKIKSLFGWNARKNLEEMCVDSFNFSFNSFYD
jgi:UDP-glucose 4-epimerase